MTSTNSGSRRRPRWPGSVRPVDDHNGIRNDEEVQTAQRASNTPSGLVPITLERSRATNGDSEVYNHTDDGDVLARSVSAAPLRGLLPDDDRRRARRARRGHQAERPARTRMRLGGHVHEPALADHAVVRPGWSESIGRARPSRRAPHRQSSGTLEDEVSRSGPVSLRGQPQMAAIPPGERAPRETEARGVVDRPRGLRDHREHPSPPSVEGTASRVDREDHGSRTTPE